MTTTAVITVMTSCVLLFFWNLTIRLLRGKLSSCRRLDDLKGQVICITGGNRGIGLETSKWIIGSGGTVILGVRDVVRCRDNFLTIFSAEEMSRIEICHLDLSSFESVRHFVHKNFLVPQRKLHCLLNNAHYSGLASVHQTADRIEYTYQVNYLSHCLLTFLLLPYFHSLGDIPSRIVHVTSRTYQFGRIQRERYCHANRNLVGYSATNVYPDTKLMQILFSSELTLRMQILGLNVTSNCVHPGGLVMTAGNQWIRGPEYDWMMRLEPLLMWVAGTPVEYAGRAVLHACSYRPRVILSPEINYVGEELRGELPTSSYCLDGGKYFNTTDEEPIVHYDNLRSDQEWLWKNTLALLGISNEEVWSLLKAFRERVV
jgi:NAD(P)-dependent dehydrogenase (short-subunit alcohol dehydrogenase family)